MNKTGWVIYTSTDAERNQDYIRWMTQEAYRLDIDLRLILREELWIGFEGNALSVRLLNEPNGKLPDFVIVRTIEPVLNEQFELMNIPCFNSSKVSRICNNKSATHLALSRLDIPMLPTCFVNTGVLRQGHVTQYPVVVKAVHGRGGKEVHLIRTHSELLDLITMYPNTDVIIQPLGPVVGKDVRVFVIGRQVVAAVLRYSHTDFRANYSLGGDVHLYQLSNSQLEMVQKVTSVFDFGLVGIDFIFDSSGQFVLNEIEDVVGSRTLSLLDPSSNLVGRYIKYIHKMVYSRDGL